MPVTPDKKKAAIVGVGMSMFGLLSLLYGTLILPDAYIEGRLFVAMLAVIFGMLLTIVSILVFVIPAAVDYMNEALGRGA